MLEDKLGQDLKTALLAGDTHTVATLRGLKNAILYAKVADGGRNAQLSDEVIQGILQKEAKKRQESIDLYRQGGREEKAAAEAAEKAIIERYLPAQLSEAAVAQLVDDVIQAQSDAGNTTMGAVITAVKQRAAGTADGALIARIVKERLAAR